MSNSRRRRSRGSLNWIRSCRSRRSRISKSWDSRRSSGQEKKEMRRRRKKSSSREGEDQLQL